MKTRKTLEMTLQSLPLLLTLALSGCATNVRSEIPVTAQDNTARLIQHPQFKRAAQAAPEWVGAALATITRLETEKANGGH